MSRASFRWEMVTLLLVVQQCIDPRRQSTHYKKGRPFQSRLEASARNSSIEVAG